MDNCKLLQKALIGVCYLRWTPIQHRKEVVKIAVNKAGRYSTLLLKTKIFSAITEGKQTHKALVFYARQQTTTLPFVCFLWYLQISHHYCCLYTGTTFRDFFYFKHLSKLKFINKYFPKSLLCTMYRHLLLTLTILVLIFSAGRAVGSCKRKERNGWRKTDSEERKRWWRHKGHELQFQRCNLLKKLLK